MSINIPEIEDAEVIFNIGYNGPASHPIVARRIDAITVNDFLRGPRRRAARSSA